MQISPATLAVLGDAVGLDLEAYRPAHVARQLERACSREGAADVAALAVLVRRDAEAAARFRRAIAVSVSGMFRDPHQFELLERDVLPRLREGGRRLRVWSAGCADGTELYSVAVLLERAEALDTAFLLGSDVLAENVALARSRPPEGLSASVRARVRFEVRDLVDSPPPPGRFGLVLCRNVAIYLAPSAKELLHSRLVAALAPGGVLMLGRSERLPGPQAHGLEPIGANAYVSQP